VLNEPAIILIATLAASGLLVLGVMDLIWPTTRTRVRRARPGGVHPSIPEVRDRVVTSIPAVGRPPVIPRTAAPVVERPIAPVVESGPVAPAPVEPVALESMAGPPMVEEPESVEAERVPPPARGWQLELDAQTTPTLEPTPEPEVEEEPEPEPAVPGPTAVVERCRELTAEMRYGDAVAEAMAFLHRADAGPASAVVTLWIEVATARDRMGDREGALEAFRAAVDAAPEEDRERVRLECGWWAATTAREAIAAVPHDGDRYTPLASVRGFVADAREIVGTMSTINAVHADIEGEFWPAYERHVGALITDRDYAEAYRLATEALSDDALPSERRSTFEEFRAATLAARIVALADRAVLAVDEHREWEAVGALERAETLLRSETSLPAARRDEAVAQVAIGYARLGRRRVDANEFEEALDPLGRAVRLSKPDAASRDEACLAMVTALNAVVDARSAMIRDVATTGNRDSAAAQAEKLWALLRSSMAAGVPQEPLTSAIASTRRLIDDLH
jgi:tetratricopeptide (TPR) repeat protein